MELQKNTYHIVLEWPTLQLYGATPCQFIVLMAVARLCWPRCRPAYGKDGTAAEATYGTPPMARSYVVHRGGSSTDFLRSTVQYKPRAKLTNPLDP
jgi:hypothetical protein